MKRPADAVAVICTDRGQHKERKLGWLRVAKLTGDPQSLPWHYQAGKGHPLSPIPVGARHNPGVPLRYRCQVCGCDVQWRPATARRIYDTLTASGMHKVDVSKL